MTSDNEIRTDWNKAAVNRHAWTDPILDSEEPQTADSPSQSDILKPAQIVDRRLFFSDAKWLPKLKMAIFQGVCVSVYAFN